jgi:hypothetical protein
MANKLKSQRIEAGIYEVTHIETGRVFWVQRVSAMNPEKSDDNTWQLTEETSGMHDDYWNHFATKREALAAIIRGIEAETREQDQERATRKKALGELVYSIGRRIEQKAAPLEAMIADSRYALEIAKGSVYEAPFRALLDTILMQTDGGKRWPTSKGYSRILKTFHEANRARD